MTPDRPLDGRRVVVTGASRGLGLAIARALANQGASLALIARDHAVLDSALAVLPGDHDAFAFDVRDPSGWDDVHASLSRHGRIDGVVTAAGVIGPIGPPGTWSIEAFRSTLDVNVVGTLAAILACRVALEAAGGAVVTLSGGGATAPFPRFDAYAASKASVVRLTENLATELGPAGVRVNAIAPGFVVTEMHDATLAAGPELVGDAYFERTRDAVEKGGGDPPELAAELAAYLCSPEAVPFTGKLLSARWDPWREAAFQRRLLDEPDFCTLRRIDGQFFDALGRE